MATAPAAGRVLVLDNERTIEGDIERQGSQYRVRRSAGELWVSRENVLRLCESLDEAYTFLRSRANLLDPDEHLRLARWCQLHGLRRQAVEEATAAVEQRPNHAESRRLLRSLESSLAKSAAGLATKPAEEMQNAPPPEVNTQSLSLFITKVQPILMNACASCHASGRGGSFKLVRVYENSLATRKTTQQNLAAVLAAMAKEHPQGNLLLIKAISVHGDMAQPAFKSKDVQAYRTLEEWIRLTIPPGPSSRETVALPVTLPPAGEHTAALDPRAPRSEAAFGEAPTPAAGKPMPLAPSTNEQAQAPPGPVVATVPIDPYDPAIFNNQAHPQQKTKKQKSKTP